MRTYLPLTLTRPLPHPGVLLALTFCFVPAQSGRVMNGGGRGSGTSQRSDGNLYMVYTYMVYIWCIYMMNISGVYIWCVWCMYMVCIYRVCKVYGIYPRLWHCARCISPYHVRINGVIDFSSIQGVLYCGYMYSFIVQQVRDG